MGEGGRAVPIHCGPMSVSPGTDSSCVWHRSEDTRAFVEFSGALATYSTWFALENPAWSGTRTLG
jgi:hypothetical protein